ncbi:zinc finger a20 and an1 domain-containing stress-associated protein 4 [Phtheirospermum japonicum]|uniref:Zinc finger a20 and an1 domain-containing stress-associated protein 4 n=1 Tax=Phtheirospermum japonicum TaxID=374723 RepID=A0A830CV33_9LAMI|nr:zinc finger a20 and an1 domain-containing stress-associated protein 4 [Phtheirospermum japonicum]
MNMCSKCYKDTVLKQEQANLAASSIHVVVTTTEAHAAMSDIVVVASPQAPAALPPPAEKIVEEVKEGPKRCGTCNKRVGLTGFTCRCGSIFCSVHRYSDKHECQFDYRSAAQEAIAKANPVVKAEKIDKI